MNYILYQSGNSYSTIEPKDPVERNLRFTYIDKNSKETIFAETRRETGNGIQNQSAPFILNKGGGWNGIGPSIEMLELFYTKNGLPIDVDPDWDYDKRYDIVDTELGKTLSLHIDREPRFNAWVAYHNSWYEISRDPDDQENTGPTDEEGHKLLVQFRKYDAQGYQERTTNYAPTGYLNKKGVSPDFDDTENVNVHFPYPIIRLAELYLNYAEALIEYGEDFATAKEYINKIRKRAGIPSIDDAWDNIGGANDQSTLRKIVRQERTIEFYYENHRFWDLRRWQIANQYLDKKLHGLNIDGETDEDLLQIREIDFPRNFETENYLMPIPQSEINKNENLVQNPGY